MHHLLQTVDGIGGLIVIPEYVVGGGSDAPVVDGVGLVGRHLTGTEVFRIQRCRGDDGAMRVVGYLLKERHPVELDGGLRTHAAVEIGEA